MWRGKSQLPCSLQLRLHGSPSSDLGLRTWEPCEAALNLRASLHHGPWSRTLEDGLFAWFDLMVQLPWSDFLKNQFTKPLGPSLGVNWIWIKRNDHAPKSECVDLFFFNVQKGQFWKNSSLTILLSSLVFIFSSRNYIPLSFYYNNISLPWALAFFYHITSFASPTAKPGGPCHWLL